MSSWAPLVGPERQENETLLRTGYDRLEPTWGQSLGAAAADAFWDHSGFGSAYRTGQMDNAIGQGPFGIGREYLQPLLGRKPVDEQRWKDSASYRPGLSYFEGMTEEAAALLAERHDERARRADILARDPGGYVRTPLLYATQFATQMADPVGVAASFIPVVGEARFARMAAQLGRPMARVVTGAVEGAVGNALLEPLVYAVAKQDQLDYSMVDSLVNVGMGAGFGAGLHSIGGWIGAGLHSIGGWIGDVLRGRGSRAQAAVSDVAIRQAAAGQEIDVRPVVRAAIDEAAQMPGTQRLEVNGRDMLSERQAASRAEVPGVQLVDHPTIEPAKAAPTYEMRDAPPAAEPSATAKPTSFDEQRKQALTALHEAYPSRKIELSSGKSVTRKGPMDLVTYLRAIGGVKDDGGELRAIDAASYNKSREVAFAKGEQFLGRLVRPDGLSLEEAARRAAQDGYIGRTLMETNEHGEAGVFSHGSSEALVEAIQKTLAAGENMEGRVWGVDDDGPVQDYIQTMRVIDQNELFEPEPRKEHWQPLTDDELADLELAGMDPRDLEGIDNDSLADELWREEMERDAASRAQPPDDPQAAPEPRPPDDPQAAPEPRPEGEPKPLTPEQEVELDVERRRSGIAAAAACMARAL